MGARGRDLHTEVHAPKSVRGKKAGFDVEIPEQLICEQEYVCRAISPYDQGTKIKLHIAANFPHGGVLRMRGLGEKISQGRPGDLYIKVLFEETSLATQNRSQSIALQANIGLICGVAISFFAILGLFLWILR